MMGILFLALLLGLSTALVCPDGGMCEDKNTCCKNTVGGYGCCPLPHAECCSDHLHCCYEGTVCDLVHAKCVNKSVSLPWMTRVPNREVLLSPQPGEEIKAVICPDQQSECPDGTTCCQLLDGSWGCCPLAKAVCCEDKLHCCPKETRCDIVHSKCVSASLESFPMMEKLPARKRDTSPDVPAESPVTSVMCPGGTSSCPDSFTCCLLTSGDYGCCPYPEATCCSDHLHCCPSNTTCDLVHGVCRSGDTHVPLLKKISAVPADVQCPGNKSACPDQTTCCLMNNDTYSCCPMPQAVCCSDELHCCPSGTSCDVTHRACVSAPQHAVMAAAAVVMATATAAVRSPVAVQSAGASVPCNGSVACADGSTCCKSAEGEWACCPLPKAVCCEDHLHCCPHGTVCNVAASTCDDPAGRSVTPWLHKMAALPSLSANSKCDRSTSCPGKSTCCRTESGGWACCPLTQAVCCEDHVHCCPHATVCNLETETCDDPSGWMAPQRWAEKTAALRSDEGEKCDGRTACPGGTTCCKTNSGRWACCTPAQAYDDPGRLGLPRRHNPPGLAVSSPARPAGTACDGQTSCPAHTTCCYMDGTHTWGCCPLPQAVCCEDGLHCCPRGHRCDPGRSACWRGGRLLPWFTKRRAGTEPAVLTDVKCDNKSSCAAGTTCCRLPAGAWGCCPLVKAVCCADHEHCCPQGYTCNMQTGTCEKKTSVLPHLRVVQSEPASTAEEDGVVPCDAAGVFHCPKQHTCCKVSTTDWACCPSPGAACCSDSHCCPAGSSCDLQAGGCSLGGAWFTDRKKDSVQGGL